MVKKRSPTITVKWSLLLLAVGYLLAFGVNKIKLGRLEQTSIHYHADLAVYVNGQKLNFDDQKYQASEEKTLHPYIHFHDGNGVVVHLEKTGYGLRDLFRSFGGDLNWRCLSLEGARFCGTPLTGLRLFVNGSRVWGITGYRPADLDRVVLSFGPWWGDISGQLAAVTDQACIYSLKCPERGTPPEEDCLAELGDTCVLPGDSAH